jgi:hypothetical protein
MLITMETKKESKLESLILDEKIEINSESKKE